MNNYPDYPFTIRQLTAEDGGGFMVFFPDLPGCIADGETIEDAVREAADAERSYLTARRELGVVADISPKTFNRPARIAGAV